DGDATITGSWTFKAEPVNPEDPKNPGAKKPSVLPKTGDAMSTSFYVCGMALIGSALLALALGLKKNNNQ
ncbi:LPXTG cell wall anchor domain-containing protein, partial [Olsenella sp. HMSC062G07]|uniref:LPXTG cell wall anchor domain-containing protein n=1 Tax=Olsenella sp. HMSC062G07 TaxID=1739330 RepID=UPI0011D15AA6